MMMRFLLLITLWLPLAASAQIILVLGDSLSASYGMPVEQGWVTLLQARLDDRGDGWRIVNASISGDTTAGGRARLPAALATNRPAVVIVELGGNDGLRGLSLSAMKENLADMISRAQSAGAKVLLVGVQLPPNYGPAYTGKFEAVYTELAREHDVALLPSLVDGIGTRENLMQRDGIHPNVLAQPMIRDRMLRSLETLIGAVPDAARLR